MKIGRRLFVLFLVLACFFNTLGCASTKTSFDDYEIASVSLSPGITSSIIYVTDDDEKISIFTKLLFSNSGGFLSNEPFTEEKVLNIQDSARYLSIAFTLKHKIFNTTKAVSYQLAPDGTLFLAATNNSEAISSSLKCTMKKYADYSEILNLAKSF